jgi:hypothetical protein
MIDSLEAGSRHPADSKAVIEFLAMRHASSKVWRPNEINKAESAA